VAHAQEVAQSSSPTAVLGLHLGQFIAQLINFGIVLLIFWKWVLPAVMKNLQSRTARIEKSLKDAERVEKEKLEFEQWRQAEMSKTRQEASSIITKAQSEANQVKDQTIQQTKEEQQKLVEQAKKQIEQEKNSMMSSAKSELADLITGTAEKILKEKMDKKKDEEIIKNALKNI